MSRLLPRLVPALLGALVVATPASAAALQPPNDPRWPDQWAMQNTGQWVRFDAPVGIPGADVRALEAWQWTQGAGAPPLAVIDSGVDFGHADLAGSAWRNPGEIAGNGVDDDANGRVDDLHGWNFYDDSADITDPVSHGTGVASVAAARADDGVGIAGIAPQTKVMALRVEDDEGYSWDGPVVEALAYAAAHGARVANVSLGMYPGFAAHLDEAIRRVPGLLVIASAANNGKDNDDPDNARYPCALTAPNVICVAATDARDELASWSNYGSQAVDLGAPGADILDATSVNLPYGWGDGTSLSAPLVSGTAQLLLAVRPDLTVAELRTALLTTGRPLATLAGKTVTGRRLDAAAALESVAGPPPSPAPDPVEPGPGESRPGPEPLEAVPARLAPARPTPAAPGVELAPPAAAATPTVAPRAATVKKPAKKATKRKATKRKRSTRAAKTKSRRASRRRARR